MYPPVLTEHFTWAEAEVTSHRKIDNTIPVRLWNNIIKTAEKMEIVRGLLSTPIYINSWFRCFELNTAIGSTSKSKHPFGTCVDFIAPKFGSPREIVAKLIAHRGILDYDQLIFEHTWVHIGWDPNGINRDQVLTLNKDGTYSLGLA